MPKLDWIGKDKVVKHHQDFPFSVLGLKYGFSMKDREQDNKTNSGSKIIHGDNIEALKSLIPEYEGRIKYIYIDSPCNTVYNDKVNHSNIKNGLEKL